MVDNSDGEETCKEPFSLLVAYLLRSATSALTSAIHTRSFRATATSLALFLRSNNGPILQKQLTGRAPENSEVSPVFLLVAVSVVNHPSIALPQLINVIGSGELGGVARLLVGGRRGYELPRGDLLEGREAKGGVALTVGLHLCLAEECLALAEVGGIFRRAGEELDDEGPSLLSGARSALKRSVYGGEVSEVLGGGYNGVVLQAKMTWSLQRTNWSSLCFS